MTRLWFLLRLAAFATLIYVGVWLDNKIARTILFTSFFLASEILGWLVIRAFDARVAKDV